MKIADVFPDEGYVLKIIDENGQIGLFDVEPYLESEAFAPLRNKQEFDQIYNGKYFIEWSCGADLSADTIEARWKKLSHQNI